MLRSRLVTTPSYSDFDSTEEGSTISDLSFVHEHIYAPLVRRRLTVR